MNRVTLHRYAGIMAGALALALIAAPPCSALKAEESVASCAAYEWNDVPRVVAIGDVHGSYGQILPILTGVGLIDENHAWTGGTDHLVFVGDLLDRGRAERPLLDLVRRLQVEAARSGGRVHVLLGNHEAMNLVRDFRYVPPPGFLAFEDFENPEDRERAWLRFRRSGRGTGVSEDKLRQEFSEKRPPGYFGRAAAFAPDGEYGAWLMGQSVAIEINGRVFVHAGLTEKTAALGLEGINRRVIAALREFTVWRSLFEMSGEIEPFASFKEVMQAAMWFEPRNSSPAQLEAQDAASGLLGFLESIAVDPEGPLWYRGNSLEDERIERDRLSEVLGILGAKAVVVGHSITRSGLIQSRFGGRLFRIDVGMSERGNPQALVFDRDGARVFEATTARYLPVAPEPPQGERSLEAHTAPTGFELERFLKRASVLSVRPLGKGSTRPLLLELESNGIKLRGLFKNVNLSRIHEDSPAVTRDRYQHEIAAYQLDRLLGLGMVPTVVARSIADHGRGSLQVWIESAVDEQGSRDYALPEVHEAKVRDQRERARVFDALIGNPDRKDTDILHLPQEGKILLVDHSKAFSSTTDLEPFLGDHPCTLDETMERALLSLNPKDVRRVLRPWLSPEQISAVLTRQETLVERCRRAPAHHVD